MLSPPNFSSAQRARVSATIASAATPAAGATHTSERSYAAFTGSRVAKSTDSSGRRSVEIGFKYPRTTMSCPFDTPPFQAAGAVRLAGEAGEGAALFRIADFVVHA